MNDKLMSLLKLVLIIGLTIVAGYIIWNKFGGEGGRNDYDFDMGDGGTVTIPKEMRINYTPADFRSTLNQEEVMRILSNPTMYRRDFNRMVYQLNMDLLYHVSKRMDLPDSLNNRVEGEYRKHHSYLKDLYFHDLGQLVDTSMYEQWYENGSTEAVKALEEVSAKYTCFLVNHVITTLLKNTNQTLAVKGRKVYSPCTVAMEEGLKPMVRRLRESAIVDDFKRSENVIQERMESVIAELATIEVRDKKGLTKELATKVWGYKVSSTDIEIRAISMAKIGFKLDDFFEVSTDTKNKQVVVTLPQPKILSHEVYPKIDKLDVGWMREIKDEDFNKIFNLLRREFRGDIMESNAFNRSKDQAEELMNTIFLPMVQSIDARYKIEVRYKTIDNEDLDPDMMDGDV